MSPDAIKSLEHIAQRLEILANDKQWLKRLSNGLTGLGCRSSLTECLRGFSTVLEELRYHKPDSAKSLQQGHKRVLLIAKSIDQKVKQGQRNLSFDALALQTSLFRFVKKHRHIAKMAREELTRQKPAKTEKDIALGILGRIRIWLKNHPHSYGLQGGIIFLVLFLIVGLFKPQWRQWCWGVAGLAFLVLVLSLLGGRSRK